jgi:hypothetical protein
MVGVMEAVKPSAQRTEHQETASIDSLRAAIFAAGCLTPTG